ncbi:hypothetical protein [Polaribacter sp.]|uniref:hypothetical protein n=1 Tax=Polaribacter sp. TaxID=1920175 RepID=UPI003F6BDC53
MKHFIKSIESYRHLLSDKETSKKKFLNKIFCDKKNKESDNKKIFYAGLKVNFKSIKLDAKENVICS